MARMARDDRLYNSGMNAVHTLSSRQCGWSFSFRSWQSWELEDIGAENALQTALNLSYSSWGN